MGTFGHLCVLILSLVSLKVGSVLGRDICESFGVVYTYCDSGYHCCENNTKCCSDSLSVGAIIGIIFGIIFLIAMCVVCAAIFMKKKSKPGRIVHTHNQPSFTVATVSAHQYGHPTGPNQYNQFGHNPYGNPGQPAVPLQPPPYDPNPVYPPPPPAYMQ